MSYPVMLDVEGRHCLVVGGGSIAERKVRNLSEAGARVHIVSPAVTAGIKEMLSGSELLTCEKRRFRRPDLEGMFLVIAATADRALNERICLLASGKGILANSVNSRTNTTFSNMAVLDIGGITVGISSDGKDPARVKALRERLGEILS